MITPKEISKRTMTNEKREISRNDYFAFYIGRPISYIFTIPFLYLNLAPNFISLLSMLPLVIGFIISIFANDKITLINIWVLFFLWNILDGVDGNVARFKKQFSKLGSVYDAMSGYLAMVFTFFSVGIIASNFNGILDKYLFNKEIYIILGALSGIFVIFPRLIMHKTISTLMDSSTIHDVKDKKNFNLIKVIALNIGSVTGGAQVLMLTSFILNIMDIYTICYFIFNLLIMIFSIYSILKKDK